MGREFGFAAGWWVRAAPESVHDVLVDLEQYPNWWPQVRAVAKLDDDHALVVCRSLLPYDLELVLGARSRGAELLEVSIDGTLTGWARYALKKVGAGTQLDYRQEVRIDGALATAGYLVGPLLRWNHAVMMRGARRGLAQRLAGTGI